MAQGAPRKAAPGGLPQGSPCQEPGSSSGRFGKVQSGPAPSSRPCVSWGLPSPSPDTHTCHEHRQISVERLPAGLRLMVTNRAERCSWGGWRLRGGGDLQKSSQDFSRLSHSAPEAGTSPPMPGLPAQPLNPRRGGAGGAGGGPPSAWGRRGEPCGGLVAALSPAFPGSLQDPAAGSPPLDLGLKLLWPVEGSQSDGGQLQVSFTLTWTSPGWENAPWLAAGG